MKPLIPDSSTAGTSLRAGPEIRELTLSGTVQAAASKPAGSAAGTDAGSGPTVWIDLENTPHIPFFNPIIRELRQRGYKVVLSAREAFQTCEMATRYGFDFTKIGHHYGQRRLNKIWGLVARSLQLLPFILRQRPDLAVNHGSRSQNLICNLLKIPTVTIMDYEHVRMPPLVRPRWEIVPDAITSATAHLRQADHLRKFQGIKEDVYVPEFTPDASIVRQLGLDQGIVVTVRPPASEALYHCAESDTLFVRFMERACRTPGVRIVLLPRNGRQTRQIYSEHPGWFKDSKIVIPTQVVDGLNLLWHSDLVVSGGGTMNREAAALGVPVYSIFRGKLGAVDQRLELEGRLTMIRSVEEVDRSILLQPRDRTKSPHEKVQRALQDIVSHIEDIIHTEHVRGAIRSPAAPRGFPLQAPEARARCKVS